MIQYNMRYRGPLEYDKFILNIFQFHNEVQELLVKRMENPASPQNTFAALQTKVNDTYNTVAGNNSLSEQFYMQTILMKEE